MSDGKKNELQATTSAGSITYANDVVAIIAGLAAGEIKGVAGMTGGGLSELLGRKNLAKGIRVSLIESEVCIEVNLSVFYGIRIQDTCQQVQINVKKAVETMTGLLVKEINVSVMGIQLDKDPNALEEQTESDEDQLV